MTKQISVFFILTIFLFSDVFCQEKAKVEGESKENTTITAFGYTLGSALANYKKLTKKGIRYSIPPIVPYKTLSHYYAEITPDTAVIYSIIASGALPNLKSAKDELEILRKLLTEKYGVAVEKDSLNSVDFFEFNIPNGIIRLVRDKTSIRVTYIDYSFMIKSNSEYQKHRELLNKGLLDDSKKKAFRDPDAL